MYSRVRRVLRRAENVSAETPRAEEHLHRLTIGFCEAQSLVTRSRRAAMLFGGILGASMDRRFVSRLHRWIALMERDRNLRERFQLSWSAMMAEVDFVPLFAETGLPSQQGFPAEVMRRLMQRIFPLARGQSDSRRLIVGIFPSSKAIVRFLERPELDFRRLVPIFCSQDTTAFDVRVREDLRQALCLLATRVAGRGASPAIRQRGSDPRIESSPFYGLIFATDSLTRPERVGLGVRQEVALWQSAVQLCSAELEQIHLHMEDAGVSSALVYDLRSIEAYLERMQMLAMAYLAMEQSDGAEPNDHATFDTGRVLIDTLLKGYMNDTRMRTLVEENLNLLARKTVERTGHGGEHYIAHTRRDYWLMWRAGLGGGLLTVFTAAAKMRLVESHFPLAIEGFLVGTDYAVSFVLLQIFGFALATKQPSMTAAALAGIVRDNRGVARWSKISAFAADISRTQLAAAFSNVIAVCAGAVLFEKLWNHVFKTHYLPVQSAQHVYQTLHPFTSGTAAFAAVTGVILWLAAVIGGWLENFAVYHRLPEALAQHPLGATLGAKTMRRAGDWLERNVASWSTSIVLGYLLGFAPVVARFFGIPLDVRHVTLTTGTLALAAARFGTSSFGHGWFYFATAGIAITFVLNLGVSFSIASLVALRAYNVPRPEQAQILKFLVQEFVSSPLSFVFPTDEDVLSISPQREGEETSAEAALGERTRAEDPR